MKFRMIKNRIQNIAVKGFIIFLCLSILLALFKVVDLGITLPFLLIWILVWIIGTSKE